MKMGGLKTTHFIYSSKVSIIYSSSISLSFPDKTLYNLAKVASLYGFTNRPPIPKNNPPSKYQPINDKSRMNIFNFSPLVITLLLSIASAAVKLGSLVKIYGTK